MATGAGGAVTTQTAQISVGGATGYADTVAGMISAINNANLGLTATFSTAAQAGKQAVAAGAGTDTGIQLSGPGAGVGSGNAPGALGIAGAASGRRGADLDVLSGSLAVTDSSGVTHTLVLGAGGEPDTIGALGDLHQRPRVRHHGDVYTRRSGRGCQRLVYLGKLEDGRCAHQRRGYDRRQYSGDLDSGGCILLDRRHEPRRAEPPWRMRPPGR